jgi:hypothetical protein
MAKLNGKQCKISRFYKVKILVGLIPEINPTKLFSVQNKDFFPFFSVKLESL